MTLVYDEIYCDFCGAFIVSQNPNERFCQFDTVKCSDGLFRSVCERCLDARKESGK